MTIQINTDSNISENESQIASLKETIKNSFGYLCKHITRIEVHLSDEDGIKEGFVDKRCVLEVRLEGRPPIAVTSEATTIEEALNDAIEKMSVSLNAILNQMISYN